MRLPGSKIELGPPILERKIGKLIHISSSDVSWNNTGCAIFIFAWFEVPGLNIPSHTYRQYRTFS